MNLTLRRTSFTASGIFGILMDQNSNIVCYTLERAYPSDTGTGWDAKIPVGEYVCIRRLSPHFGYDLFMLENVPGHDFIEIHIANWERQLNGCIAVGESIKGDMLMESKKAFDALMLLQDGFNEFQLVVKD